MNPMKQPTQATEADFAPVFIVGFPRSGTTLLATLLGRHSQFAATPETHFLDQVVPRFSRASMFPPQVHAAWIGHALACIRFQDLELAPTLLLDRFRAYPADVRNLLRASLELYAENFGKPRVVEKTPAHLEHVGRILRWYPHARVVYIVRDGRDACMSMLRAPWTHNNLRRHARDWTYQTRLGHRAMRRYPGRILQVRFESLVQKPETVLGEICAFLDAPFETTMLDPETPSSSVTPEWELSWKRNAEAIIDPARVGVWREAPVEQRWLMNSMMGRWLRRLGYSDTALTGCPPATRVRHAVLNRLFRMLYHPALRPMMVGGKRLLHRAGLPTDHIDRPEVDANAAAAAYRKQFDGK